MSPATGKTALRAWILACNPRITPDQLADDTPILKRRVITSLQLVELILFLETLRQRPIDPESLDVGAFDSIDAISRTLLEANAA